MLFTDTSPMTGARKTKDGYLSAEIRSARTGIQTYQGSELGKPELATVQIYRSPDEVFAADALASMAHRPVVMDHPATEVSAANWRDLAVGMTGDVISRDGGYVRVPLALMDANAIADVEAGKREVSWGYSCDLVWGDGITPDGEKYQARQVGIRANHLAVVTKGRAGSACRIGDGITWGNAPPINNVKGTKMTDKSTLQTILHDGVPVETTDAGAAVIKKLEQRVSDAATKATEIETANAKVLATKDAEIDALKAKVITDAALDARVAQRAALVTSAKAIVADVKTDGVSDADIRKAVVVAKLGDAAIADKSAAYIDARFDILSEGIGDPLRKALADGVKPQSTLATIYQERDTALSDAWKTPTKKEA